MKKNRRDDIYVIVFLGILVICLPSLFYYFYVIEDNSFPAASFITFYGVMVLFTLAELLGLVVYLVGKVMGFSRDKKKPFNEVAKPTVANYSKGVASLIKKDIYETDRFTLIAVGGVFVVMLSTFMALYLLNEQTFKLSFNITLFVGMVLLGMGVVLKVATYFICSAWGLIRKRGKNK